MKEPNIRLGKIGKELCISLSQNIISNGMTFGVLATLSGRHFRERGRREGEGACHVTVALALVQLGAARAILDLG